MENETKKAFWRGKFDVLGASLAGWRLGILFFGPKGEKIRSMPRLGYPK